MFRSSFSWAGVWAWPIALGLLTSSGLVSALVSDGLGDAWAWFALGTPVAVMAWLGWPKAATRIDAHPATHTLN